MKKIILLIAIIMASFLSAYSQSEHLEFKGMPIDGHYSDFVAELKSQGFKESRSIDEAVILEGLFTGKKSEVYYCIRLLRKQCTV